MNKKERKMLEEEKERILLDLGSTNTEGETYEELIARLKDIYDIEVLVNEERAERFDKIANYSLKGLQLAVMTSLFFVGLKFEETGVLRSTMFRENRPNLFKKII